MSHVHVDHAAVLRLRDVAREIRRQGSQKTLVEELIALSDHFAVVIEERDALQARLDKAAELIKRYVDGGYGYEGNMVAVNIQEALELK